MKIICIGRNYADHIKELSNSFQKEIIFFLKPETAISIKGQPFFIPDFSNNIEHEIEIILKINKVGKFIQEKYAHKYFEEISVGIDFTARDLQNNLKKKGLPWEAAKSFDGSATIGTFIKKDKFDINNLNFSLKKNGIIVQNGNSKSMINNFNKVISYVSNFITLKKGDIIFTGTPSGVSTVKENDVLEGFLENIKLFETKVI
ncbi:MAG: 2-hydroxyhepta-2,4-diene-1,7-dioate isomerase [Flavobacteriales bacterium]|nr:2-hydroxyhepta-2,4-diene-1,7-dioate isomerase [Flavobacteriales bacterium]|tara:strand:- start:2081 stop:2689 length:609 start_codon:yes stop_codon:yes gene_type:complete